jgi:hypothetical protein
MNYGHPKHAPSAEDLTVIYCRCGWHSKELTGVEKAALGLPWYCGGCDATGLHWITFHPRERAEAYDSAHIEMPAEPVA